MLNYGIIVTYREIPCQYIFEIILHECFRGLGLGLGLGCGYQKKIGPDGNSWGALSFSPVRVLKSY
jgi:hypothetical protein